MALPDFPEFVQAEIQSRLTAIDIINLLKYVGSESSVTFTPEDGIFQLTIPECASESLLDSIKYLDFLKSVLDTLEITDRTYPVFASFVDDFTLIKFRDFLSKKSFTLLNEHRELVLRAHPTIISVCGTALAEIHTFTMGVIFEVSESQKLFDQHSMKLSDQVTNSKYPTALQNWIEAWVHDGFGLNVSPNPTNALILVA